MKELFPEKNTKVYFTKGLLTARKIIFKKPVKGSGKHKTQLATANHNCILVIEKRWKLNRS